MHTAIFPFWKSCAFASLSTQAIISPNMNTWPAKSHLISTLISRVQKKHTVCFVRQHSQECHRGDFLGKGMRYVNMTNNRINKADFHKNSKNIFDILMMKYCGLSCHRITIPDQDY